MADDKNKSKSSKEETSAAASAPASDTGVRADAAPSEPAPKAVRKVKFAVEQKSPTLEIGQGDYVRKFDVKDEPFECVTGEEFELLLRTKHFIPA